MDKRFVIGAMITTLRVRKESIGGVRSYSCYDFGNYANVPTHGTQLEIISTSMALYMTGTG